MKIDPSSGGVTIGSFSVSPETRLEDVVKSRGFHDAEMIVDNGEWRSFRVKIDDKFVAILVFSGQEVAEVRLAAIGASASWEGWSLTTERKVKQVHDRLLESQLGEPPYKLDWGVVESVMDERGGASQIIIRYQ